MVKTFRNKKNYGTVNKIKEIEVYGSQGRGEQNKIG